MIDQGRLIAQIVLGVCELRKCQANSILAPRRHKEAMYNRMLVYLIAHDYCQLSYSGIARVLNRDHTTVIHGVKRAIGEYETNADFRKDYIQLTQEVRLWMEQHLSTTSTSPSNSFHSHVLQRMDTTSTYPRTCPAPSYGQIHMTCSVSTVPNTESLPTVRSLTR